MAGCAHASGEFSRLFSARDYVTQDHFEVGECARCGLVVTSPPPDPERLGRYYPPEYYRRAGASRFPSPVERAQQQLYRQRARTVERLLGGRPGRVLDVGCGPGFLLEAFRRRGWEVQGTELSESSAAHAQAELGLDVHVGSIESWPWPDGHFDAVVMWHALEHWPDPRQVIEQLQRLVRVGGVVMIGVPNFASLEARATRDAWFHLDVPRHLAHLTAKSLRSMLQQQGLKVHRESYFAPEFDLFSFIQSVENRLGLRHNLLYGLLRQGTGTPGRQLEKALAVALAAPLGLVGLPLTALLSLARQGSSMTLHAVKGS